MKEESAMISKEGATDLFFNGSFKGSTFRAAR